MSANGVKALKLWGSPFDQLVPFLFKVKASDQTVPSRGEAMGPNGPSGIHSEGAGGTTTGLQDATAAADVSESPDHNRSGFDSGQVGSSSSGSTPPKQDRAPKKGPISPKGSIVAGCTRKSC